MPIARAALALIALYGACYGLAETAGRPGPGRLRPPGRAWQVPSAWVDNAPRWRKALVWGALLGPGFATRNPYAGFALLPLVAASAGSVRAGAALAAAIGLGHAAGRAGALLRDLRRAASADYADYLDTVVRSMRWRAVDGAALLAVCGIAVSVFALSG